LAQRRSTAPRIARRAPPAAASPRPTALVATAAAIAPSLRPVLLVYLLAVAVTRVSFGAHFPLDVVVGTVIGYQVGRFSAALTRAAGLLPARAGVSREHVPAGLAPA
jgi:membrane-associated phospholipid phosphatase